MNQTKKRTVHLLLLTHGDWGRALVESAQTIAGKIHNTHTFPLEQDKAVSEYIEEIRAFAEQKKPDEVFLISDLRGGTTSNVAAVLCHRHDLYGVSGLSMDMLLLADDLREHCETCSQLAEQLVESGKDKIINLRGGQLWQKSD